MKDQRPPGRTGRRTWVYFFPLNVARLQAVLQESMREFPWEAISEIIDFGSAGNAQRRTRMLELWPPSRFSPSKKDATAIQLHRDLTLERFLCRWAAQLPAKLAAGTLGVFSYSLVEEPEAAKRLFDFDHILIISPSTRARGAPPSRNPS